MIRDYGSYKIEGIENKRIPNAPQNENYKYYRVEYEGKEYYCYVQKYNDIMLHEKKEVGFLSVNVDGFERGGILPFPSTAYRIDEEDDDILHSFIKEYTKEVSEDDYEDAISSYYSEFDY